MWSAIVSSVSELSFRPRIMGFAALVRKEGPCGLSGGAQMRLSYRKLALFAAALAMVPVVLLTRARGSDHADTPAIAQAPGTDLTDVFVFPSPTNANNVVLAMCVHP